VGRSPTPTATARADAPSSSAMAAPSLPTVEVTAGITGATARLQVGQTLVVHSPNNKPGKAGAMVAEPGSRVLRGLGGNAATGWRFLATAPGTVHVVVSYGPSCAAGEVCPQFRALLGRVTVVVR